MFHGKLDSHFDAGFEIRYRTSMPPWVKAFRELFIFFQYTFFLLDFSKANSIALRSPTLLRIINNALLLNTWLFNTKYVFELAIFPMILNILIILYFLRVSNKISQGIYVHKYVLYFYRMYLEIVVPISQIQNFFVINQIFDMLINSFSLLLFLAFISVIANLLIIAMMDYASEVFFRPRVFIINSVFDFNNANTDHLMFWLRFSIVTFQLLLTSHYHFMLEIVVFMVYPICMCIVMEKRVSKGVHGSFISFFLSDGPVVAAPYILLSNIHSFKLITPIFALLLTFVFHTIFYILYKIFVNKYALLVMSEGYEPPWWFPISTAMAMRHVAETEMNLENFENYLMLRMNHDPEELIEVVRFFGIFKSQRKRLTLMLSMFKCNSIYYNYQFYVFKKIFTAHECGCPKFYQENLDKLHREFLVGMTLFWKARENNEKIKAFIYATKTAFTHIEMMSLVNYLVFIYHYDYFCHHSFSEILLVAQGEPRKSYLYRRFANILRDNPNSVPDFIFKKIEQYYPLSHEMVQNEVSKSEDTFSRGSKSAGYSQFRFHIDESTIFREDDKDNSNIAMMVIKSKRFKALGLTIALVMSLMWACVYSDKTIRLQDLRDKSIMNIKNLVSETIEASTQLSAGLIMQPMLTKYENDIKVPEKCKEILPMIYEDIKEYLTYVNKNYQFFTKSLCYYSEYIAKSDCITLSNSSKVIVETLNLIKKNYQYFDQNISTIFNINFTKIHLKLSLLLLLLSFVGGFISITLTFFNVNYSLMNIPKEAYRFLASNERLSLLLLKKSLEMCDLFQLIFPQPDKNDIPKPSIRPSSIVTQNSKERRTLNVIKASARKHISISPCTPHVSLKDAKVRVSFLGADQMLSPATFALMSPFVSSSTPPTGLNASNSSFICSSNSSNTSASASEVEDDFSDSSIFDNSANDSTSPPNELTIPADSVDTMDLVTKTIENTESSYKIFNINLLFVFIIPWLMTYFIVMYSGIVINFQQNKNLEFMNNIYKDIKEFHILPEKMYRLFINESNYIKNTKKMIKQLSKHSRNLPNLVENADIVLSFSMTGWLSWSIFAYVFWILLGCAMYHIEKSLDEGYDSLFHFPTSYIEDIKQEKDSAPQKLSADNILEIIITTDTRYINNVSPNCEQALQMQPIDLIGLKYDDIFILNQNKFRVYNNSSKKNKKFIENIRVIGKITRIALYDVSTDNKPKSNIQNVLSKQISPQMAKIFTDNGFNRLSIKNAFVIIAIYDNSDLTHEVDDIFLTTYSLMQCYSTVNLVRIEGCSLYFVCEGRDKAIPLLFIRDLICALNSKKQTNPLWRSIVLFRTDFNSQILMSDEPFVNIDYPSIKKVISNCFKYYNQDIVVYDNNHSDEYEIIKFNEIEKIVSQLY